jgi:hypothetical protein
MNAENSNSLVVRAKGELLPTTAMRVEGSNLRGNVNLTSLATVLFNPITVPSVALCAVRKYRWVPNYRISFTPHDGESLKLQVVSMLRSWDYMLVRPTGQNCGLLSHESLPESARSPRAISVAFFGTHPP